MKKLLTAITVAAALVTTTGCSNIKEWWNDNKAEIHQQAVDKAFVELDKVAVKKLNDLLAQQKITQEEYDALMVRLAKSEKDLRQLIDDMYAKYKAEHEEPLPEQTEAEAAVK